MRIALTQNIVEKQVVEKRVSDLRDTRLKGLILRIQPSGVKSYYCEYARGKRVWLGRADALGLSQARDAARKILVTAYQGVDPNEEKKRKRNVATYGEYLDVHYEPWAKAYQKTYAANLQRLRATFKSFLGTPMPLISTLDIEKWRTKRLESGIALSTVNRDIITLKASLNRAVDWELLPANPIAKVKWLRDATTAIVRFLTPDEEQRLREALDDREERKRSERDSANGWRHERGYALLPDLRQTPFYDHLKPMILLSINSGIRRGELFALTWANINFDQAIITVEAATAKSKKTRHIPLNQEARKVLTDWRAQCASEAVFVFEYAQGQQFNRVKTSWINLLKAAKIEKFRWHDMRHHFASRLAMAGVDLNAIRELLGHSDYAMTLRYAHLAPEHKRKAVEMLDVVR
jgi:integrase